MEHDHVSVRWMEYYVRDKVMDEDDAHALWTALVENINHELTEMNITQRCERQRVQVMMWCTREEGETGVSTNEEEKAESDDDEENSGFLCYSYYSWRHRRDTFEQLCQRHEMKTITICLIVPERDENEQSECDE
jgi:hypothetical protein